MNSSLPLCCACGTMRGHARLSGSHCRLCCHCGDCQAFACYLERTDEILDAYGGTEMMQIPPARIELTEGVEHLACMRLSDKGLMRWYAGCCRTPVAITLARPRMPFVMLLHTFMSADVDAAEREQMLGPIRTRVTGKIYGDSTEDVSIDRFPVVSIVHSIRQLLGAWIHGEHQPSPFFDADHGAPRVEPCVLGTDEREALRRPVEQWRARAGTKA